MSTTKRSQDEHGERIKLQFPIQQEVRYQCIRRGRVSAVGVGKTVRMSSREVQFTTQSPTKPGDRVRLAVDWPVMLDKICLMKLEICGSVIRSGPGAAEVKIARYEFRTRSALRSVMHSSGA